MRIDRVRRHREARRARIGIWRRAGEVPHPALRESRIEAPKCRASERNGAEAEQVGRRDDRAVALSLLLDPTEGKARDASETTIGRCEHDDLRHALVARGVERSWRGVILALE